MLLPCSGDCDPSCDSDEYCVGGETCHSAPVFAEAGELSVGGLAVAVSLEPAGRGYSDVLDLPAALFDPGDAVSLTASGGATAAFSASATGVEPLDATLACDEIPRPDEDLVLSWTPSAEAGARIRWTMAQDVHLSQGPRIRCEAEDTGTLTVPVELMEAYLCGKRHVLELTRYTVGTAEIAGSGQVAFEVGSMVTCTVNEDYTPW